MKNWYWTMRSEIPEFFFWFLNRLPGKTGIKLRKVFLPRWLGACGTNPVFHTNIRITNPERLKIGDSCAFADGTFFTAGGGITIGNFVATGPDVKIWSVNHRFEDPDIPWMEQGYEQNPVVIEDDVWLGASVFVKPGVRIGKGAIISAGTVLSKSVPAFSIVAGNPGRVVGWRKRPEGGGSPLEKPGIGQKLAAAESQAEE
ncbi:MAG: acyltransferase [Fibrobacteres bacterium]|nr:acyltransferase [Fibrobacterota bacterium]